MKRNLKAQKSGTIKEPRPPKTDMRKFEDTLEEMTSLMSTIYKNQVLLELNQTTQRKFSDAKNQQIGNFATIALNLAGAAERKLRKRFSDERIKNFTTAQLSSLQKRQGKKLYSQFESVFGIKESELFATEGLSSTINAYTIETSQWVKKLRDENLENYTANTLRAMREGKSLAEILSEFDGLVETRKNQAKFNARNQITNFNSAVNDLRVLNLGITEGFWQTSGSEVVRPSHKQRNGKRFNLKEGLYSSLDGKKLKTGVDFNCQCVTRYIIPKE